MADVEAVSMSELEVEVVAFTGDSAVGAGHVVPALLEAWIAASGSGNLSLYASRAGLELIDCSSNFVSYRLVRRYVVHRARVPQIRGDKQMLRSLNISCILTSTTIEEVEAYLSL